PTPRPRSTPNQTGVLRGLTTQLQLEVQVSLSVTANCQTHTHTHTHTLTHTHTHTPSLQFLRCGTPLSGAPTPFQEGYFTPVSHPGGAWGMEGGHSGCSGEAQADRSEPE